MSGPWGDFLTHTVHSVQTTTDGRATLYQ